MPAGPYCRCNPQERATDGRQDRATLAPEKPLRAQRQPPPSTLRLYTEPAARSAKCPGANVPGLPEVLQAFQRATGWSLDYIPEQLSKVAGGNRRPN